MLRSDDPCAMATTLMPPASSAVNTRAEMPGVPAMPSPTTATTDICVRALTPSIQPCAISSRRPCFRHATARVAWLSGAMQPIELSEDAWKIVDTDNTSELTYVKMRAAKPGTTTMPRPATEHSDCA